MFFDIQIPDPCKYGFCKSIQVFVYFRLPGLVFCGTVYEGKGIRGVMLQVMERRAYGVCMPCFGARGFGVLV